MSLTGAFRGSFTGIGLVKRQIADLGGVCIPNLLVILYVFPNVGGGLLIGPVVRQAEAKIITSVSIGGKRIDNAHEIEIALPVYTKVRDRLLDLTVFQQLVDVVRPCRAGNTDGRQQRDRKEKFSHTAPVPHNAPVPHAPMADFFSTLSALAVVPQVCLAAVPPLRRRGFSGEFI